MSRQNGTQLNPSPAPLAGAKSIAVPTAAPAPAFDRPAILKQSPRWSRAIVWVIVGVTSLTIVWACLAKFEEAVPAQGKLEPEGAVNDVQAPLGGVVKRVHVREGQRVEAGDVLVTFDQTAARAQYKALSERRAILLRENQLYRAQTQGTATTSPHSPADLELLARNRSALMAENRLYQAHRAGAALPLPASSTLQARQAEINARVASTRLEMAQLQRQLNQVRIQLEGARFILADNEKILADIEPLFLEGGIARVQYVRQRQEMRNNQTQVARLEQEVDRLQLAIAQTQQQLQNTLAQAQADNERRIAEIDSQLAKVLVDNQRAIQQIDSELSQTKLTLAYQELRAPVSGIVFDLQATGPGYVVNTSEPMLQLVPQGGVLAQVFITNRDIGFVEQGMAVDVRIDSFPYSEFGDVEGTLVQIGSDALPPDEIHPFYRFPAEIQLDRQTIAINQRDIPLQSGMSVSANIKVRKRTVASIFGDLFAKKIDSLKSGR